MRLFKKKRTRSNGLIKGGGGLISGGLKTGGLTIGVLRYFSKDDFNRIVQMRPDYQTVFNCVGCSPVWG